MDCLYRQPKAVEWRITVKIELHAHTQEASPCAHVPASQIPAMYQSAGYDGIVITDHYCKWVKDQSGSTSPQEYARYFLKGYQTAREAGSAIGFTVLLGAEVNLLESPNDYLLYGIDENFLMEHPQIYALTLRQLYELCHSKGILLFQAHPYRTYCTPANPEYLDGAESYNGNPRHNNQNDSAAGWTAANHLIPSSGSDFHETEDVAKGGIETETDVTDIPTLCKILQEGRYRLIKPDGKGRLV